jgi:transposase
VTGALAFHWDAWRTRFYFQTRPGSSTAVALIAFLRQLKRHFRGRRVVLLWDRLGAHKSGAMRAYLGRQRAWLTVEPLPGYAPELNPIEQVWGNVKGGELANVCAEGLAGLRHPAHRGLARIRRQPHLAFAFLRHNESH